MKPGTAAKPTVPLRSVHLLGWFLWSLLDSCKAFSPFSNCLTNHHRCPSAVFMVDPWNDKQTIPIVWNDVNPVGDEDAGRTAAPEVEKSFGFGSSVPFNRNRSISKQQQQQQSGVQKQQRRNIAVALVSVVLALAQYAWLFTHPTTPVSLLLQMTQESSPPSIIGKNNKPTVVDFWAPWCENCQIMAPTMRALHDQYQDRVNFVTINAAADSTTTASNPWPYIEAFRVDAIPHLALVNAEGDVETALIGLIPKSVMEADLDVLLQNSAASASDCSSNTPATTTLTLTTVFDDDGGRLCQSKPEKPLPYRMLDVFQAQPDQRRMRFD